MPTLSLYDSIRYPREYPSRSISKAFDRLEELAQKIDIHFLSLFDKLNNNSKLQISDLKQFSELFNQLSQIGSTLYERNEFVDAWSNFIERIYRNLQDRLILRSHTLFGDYIVHNSKELIWAESYRKSGFFQFQIEEQSINELKILLSKEADELYARYRRRDDLSRGNLSINQFQYATRKKIAEILGKEGVLRSATAGLNCDIESAGFALELSVPEATWWKSNVKSRGQLGPAKTAYFHRDETPLVPKAILYLSKVDMNNGPFQIVPSSLNSESSPIAAEASRMHFYPINQLREMIPELSKHELFEAFESLLPPTFRVDSHFGFNIADDSESAQQILDNTITFCGDPGLGICFDGYSLLHRGGLVNNSTRLALQIMLPAVIPANDEFSNFVRGI